jgi:hypothetical protein
LLAGGRIPTAALIEPGAVALDGLVSAMVELAAGRTAGKVLVQPNPEVHP